MIDFVRLEQAIRSSTVLAVGVCGLLFLVTIASLGFAVYVIWGGASDRGPNARARRSWRCRRNIFPRSN
jgi:hypothetical protein